MADITKMREVFDTKNSFSLNQAYILKELTRANIAMLPEDENIVRKQPREEFLTLTNRLQHSLINKIELKQNFRPIGVIIDLMERVWSTIEAFPNLGKNISKKLQEIEAKERLDKDKDFGSTKISEKECLDAFS